MRGVVGDDVDAELRVPGDERRGHRRHEARAEVLYGHQMDKLTTYISTDSYHQHNPGVGDGLAGFGEAMADLAKAGLSMVYAKTYRYVAEGDLVFTHSEGTFAGRHVVFADLFRVENGKIVEHWDVIQDVPATTASGLSMF